MQENQKKSREKSPFERRIKKIDGAMKKRIARCGYTSKKEGFNG